MLELARRERLNDEAQYYLAEFRFCSLQPRPVREDCGAFVERADWLDFMVRLRRVTIEWRPFEDYEAHVLAANCRQALTAAPAERRRNRGVYPVYDAKSFENVIDCEWHNRSLPARNNCVTHPWQTMIDRRAQFQAERRSGE